MQFFRRKVLGLHEVVVVCVNDSDIEKAKVIRERRDRLYPNIYPPSDTDLRWVGDLGELYFRYWLCELQVDFVWLHEDESATHNADFIVEGVRYGVKAVKRKADVKAHYTQGISKQHANEPVDMFFFMSYEYPRKLMWLLGGCTKEFFLANARAHKAGEQVHSNYTIREGHELLNLDVRLLTAPALLIQGLWSYCAIHGPYHGWNCQRCLELSEGMQRRA
jgi:hypothetical protein